MEGHRLQRHRFESMGTWVECLVEAPSSPALDAAFAHVDHDFARLERKLSRFRADSELSRLNRERSIEASDELLELTRLALAAREHTGGRFDPTIHDALVAAGYDRTFSELRAEARIAPPATLNHPQKGVRPLHVITPPPTLNHPQKGVRPLHVSGWRIELGPGASLDLGGIAKGWAADRCVTELAAFGPALVNAGGDLAVSGPRADGPWPVAVDLTAGGAGGRSLVLGIAQGGLATTGRDRRRWIRDGQERHHVIDPRTLQPAQGGPISVTVTAPTATEAEVAAKNLFLAGRNAEREARLAGIPAVIAWDGGDHDVLGVAA
jgi:FAD:protein FMN transferase